MLTRRNAIGILMGVELILNSANINYLAFAFYGGGKYDGQIFAIFVIMLAAAEAVIGLAVVLAIYQNFKTIDVEATETLSGYGISGLRTLSVGSRIRPLAGLTGCRVSII